MVSLLGHRYFESEKSNRTGSLILNITVVPELRKMQKWYIYFLNFLVKPDDTKIEPFCFRNGVWALLWWSDCATSYVTWSKPDKVTFWLLFIGKRVKIWKIHGRNKSSQTFLSVSCKWHPKKHNPRSTAKLNVVSTKEDSILNRTELETGWYSFSSTYQRSFV